MSFQLRAAEAADLPAILAIYNDAVVHTTASYDYTPRSEARQRDWFTAKQEGGWPVLVAESGGTLAGYASYGPFRAWDGYRFSVEHSVYVDQRFRRQGIASALVNAVMDAARGRGMHLMVGAIDAANTGSIELHRKLGFEEAGVLREAGYKFERWLDLAFLTKKLI
jgi:L-amino acid N-acyltransferase